MNKQIVYFSYLGFTVDVGRNANVYALNHPRLGSQHVITSTVLSVEEADVPGGVGKFETLNTLYVHCAMPDADDDAESVPHNPSPLLGQAEEELTW